MVTFNVDSLDFVDDEEARFGNSDEFATRYSSSNSRLELEDLTNAATAFVPTDVGTDLVGGKFAETVSEGKALSDNGQVYDSIQAAVDNASSWVKVGPGDFRESVTIDTAGLTLEGSGERTVIDGLNGKSIESVSSNVTIRKFSVRNNKEDGTISTIRVAGANTTIQYITVEQADRDGVLVDAGASTVNNVTVSEAQSTGINLNSGAGSIILNSKVSSITGNFDFQRAIRTNSANSIISNCRVNQSNGGGIRVAGGAPDCILYGNTITDVVNYGISSSGNAVIAKNRIIGGDITGGNSNLFDSNLITE